MFFSAQDDKPLEWTVTVVQVQVHTMMNNYLQGLFTENKDKIILGALNELVNTELESVVDIEAQFHALRRLAVSKVGFTAFTSLSGFREAIGNRVVKALKRQDFAVTQAAIECICALMQPMHDNCDLRQEQLNKSSLLSSNKFLESLLEMWMNHVVSTTFITDCESNYIAVNCNITLLFRFTELEPWSYRQCWIS